MLVRVGLVTGFDSMNRELVQRIRPGVMSGPFSDYRLVLWSLKLLAPSKHR
jgi:hypothetical protein